MAHVHLVNAHWGALFAGRVRRYNRAFPPLDLLSAAAVLRRAGHSVSLSDARARPDRPALVGQPDLVAVTLSPLDRWQCPNTDLAQADRFLAPFPRDRTVLLGAQVTLRPEAVLRRLSVAGAVLGEPEDGLLALADGGRVGEVPSSAALRGDAFVRAPDGPAVDVAALPAPAFDLVSAADYRYEVLGSHLGLLELTRGCPWRCKYCLLTMYGKRYRKKSVPQMLAEIDAAWASGVRVAYFQDLEFTADRERVVALCEALIARRSPLVWACQTRPDTVDKALLVLMRRAGCALIQYGVESGVPRVLALTEKRQTREEAEAAVRWAHEVGLRTLCYFLLGLPTETRDEMWRTYAFAEQLSPTYASFQVATPYPTTPFFDELGLDGGELFPSEYPSALSGDTLRGLAREFTLRYHLRPAYLRQRLRGPGRRQGLQEAWLLARYALWPFA